MSYYLPTLSSLHRHEHTIVRPRRLRREPPPPSNICSHRLTVFGGRCPQCYRDSMRRYSSRIRRVPLVRRRDISPVPPIPPPITRFPIIHHPRAPRPRPTPIPTYSIKIVRNNLPGKCMVQPNKTLLCSICYDGYERDSQCQILPCEHKFHVKCFGKWFVRKKNCPLCRKNYM
jgi:hypothetical protein